jgi:hypothetical protein
MKSIALVAVVGSFLLLPADRTGLSAQSAPCTAEQDLNVRGTGHFAPDGTHNVTITRKGALVMRTRIAFVSSVVIAVAAVSISAESRLTLSRTHQRSLATAAQTPPDPKPQVPAPSVPMRSSKPTLKCGMTIIHADPSIDPRIFARRNQTPQLFGPGVQKPATPLPTPPSAPYHDAPVPRIGSIPPPICGK